MRLTALSEDQGTLKRLSQRSRGASRRLALHRSVILKSGSIWPAAKVEVMREFVASLADKSRRQPH